MRFTCVHASESTRVGVHARAGTSAAPVGRLRLRDGLTALRQTRQDVRRIHIRVLEDDEVGKHHTRNVLHGHFDLCVRFVNALVDRVPAGVGTGESRFF